jgi:hypothetical protein
MDQSDLLNRGLLTVTGSWTAILFDQVRF